MLPFERLHAVLVQNNVSRTKARDEIYLALKRCGPCMFVDVIRTLEGKVARKTVYNALNVFIRIGVAVWVGPGLIEVGPSLDRHHHHFVCAKCGIRVDFWDEQLEAKIERVAKRRNLVLTGHLVELTGVCGLCALNYQI